MTGAALACGEKKAFSMSSNVHALARVRTLRAEIGRPERAEVEAAVRTILRWTGDETG